MAPAPACKIVRSSARDLRRQLRGSIGASKLAQREAQAISLLLAQCAHPPSAVLLFVSFTMHALHVIGFNVFDLRNLLAVRSVAKGLVPDIRQAQSLRWLWAFILCDATASKHGSKVWSP